MAIIAGILLAYERRTVLNVRTTHTPPENIKLTNLDLATIRMLLTSTFHARHYRFVLSRVYMERSISATVGAIVRPVCTLHQYV